MRLGLELRVSAPSLIGLARNARPRLGNLLIARHPGRRVRLDIVCGKRFSGRWGVARHNGEALEIDPVE